MLHRAVILTFIFAVGIVKAFAVSSDNPPPRVSEDSSTAAAATSDSHNGSTDLLSIDTGFHSTSTMISPKKMKSNTFRWFVRGVIGELYHNIFLRQIKRLARTINRTNKLTCRQHPRNEIAIVTGATGGIGSHMAHELAFRGYDVVVAARDATRGNELVDQINEKLREAPTCGGSNNENASPLPIISFVEYHADNPQSALNLASSVKNLDGQVVVLINNAGIMGKSKQLTPMRVNLLGPVLLTLAILPLINNSSSKIAPTVINVGATSVIDDEITLEKNETYISALPNVDDKDLSTYSRSKLALMQFSTLLRHSLSKSESPIRVYDAHPGLVWTPLLRNHIGDKATNILRNSGLANLIYKSAFEGAQAIVSALDHLSSASKVQIYFENGKPGGYATQESRNYSSSLELWEIVISPEIEGISEVYSLDIDQ